MAYTGYERYNLENERRARNSEYNRRRVDRNVKIMQANERQAVRNNRAKVEQYINAMPEGFTIESLPQKYDNKLQDFLQKGKEKYYQAATQIQNYEPGSDGYRHYKDQMTAVKNSYKSAKTQVDLFGNQKKDISIDLTNGTYSKGNDINEMGLLTDVYTDKYDMVFNENGTIGFDDGNGNVTQFNELPDYFNKDFKTGDAIQKMATSIYKSGQQFNPATKMMYRNQLSSMIEQGGTETLYSLATDDFFNKGGLGIPTNVLKDPNRRDEVEEMVIDNFLKVLEVQADAGFQYKPKTKKKQGDPSSDESYFPSGTNDWIKNDLPNMPMESDEEVLTAWEQSGVLGKNYKLISDGAGGYVVSSVYGKTKYVNVGTYPKTDHTKFLDIIKRNGIK